LEDLPKVLYDKLDEILAKTEYQSITALAGSSHEQIVLIDDKHSDLWIEVNDGSLEGKPVGTMDMYHIKTDDRGNQIRFPHLRIFVDVLFGSLDVRYLQQPEVKHHYTPNPKQTGKMEAYFYTLGWFVSLSGREYR